MDFEIPISTITNITGLSLLGSVESIRFYRYQYHTNTDTDTPSRIHTNTDTDANANTCLIFFTNTDPNTDAGLRIYTDIDANKAQRYSVLVLYRYFGKLKYTKYYVGY